jgi:hypothetical protein
MLTVVISDRNTEAVNEDSNVDRLPFAVPELVVIHVAVS